MRRRDTKPWPRALALAGGLAALLIDGAQQRATPAEALPELHTAAEIRRLTPQEAARHYPVKLQGVVTFYDRKLFYHFIRDDTAGIYFDVLPDSPTLEVGQRVEIVGETGPGEYAPMVMASRIQILGQSVLSAAKPVSYEQLVSGQEDSQFVEVHGIVHWAQRDSPDAYFSIELATGGGRLTALSARLPVEKSQDLVDSTVRIRGVCTSYFNRQRQLFDTRLLVPRAEDLVIDRPAPQDLFAIPLQPIENLLQFAPSGVYGQRVKVFGTVTYRMNDDELYIQDATEGLQVETKQVGPLRPGDRVEVLGFAAKGEYTPVLQDAVFRLVGSGPVVEPDKVTADEALKGTHDCRLVTIEATVVDRARHSREQFLVLESAGFIFHAYLERKGGGTDFAYLENGSRVAITGVCLIERGKDWSTANAWRAKSFRLLLRSAGDIFLLQRPPWWNLRKLLWAIASLLVTVVAAFAWVAILGRRVHQQTEIIRQKLETEAALKERYEDLFENANEMVFTCDLGGRMTTINRTGEQLLRQSRQKILSKRLIDLVSEEQRAAVGQWLGQLVEDEESAPAEWDFITGSGARIRLEIGARIVKRQGKGTEIEGIARDITERKRLEQEILEISNREQQRLGHDLHDGVCQQLAGIAYRADILADQLQDKGLSESGEAERIGSLIQGAINQARGIARGLFPVQLEENGLISALEDLAASTRNFFNVRCEFEHPDDFPELERSVALHLYYIIQEAVLNAAKHSQAAAIRIALERDEDRLTATVEDDGRGFRPLGEHDAGMGIRIMRYRARMIGATLGLITQPGHGTQVTCRFYSTSRVLAEAGQNERRTQ